MLTGTLVGSGGLDKQYRVRVEIESGACLFKQARLFGKIQYYLWLVNLSANHEIYTD